MGISDALTSSPEADEAELRRQWLAGQADPNMSPMPAQMPLGQALAGGPIAPGQPDAPPPYAVASMPPEANMSQMPPEMVASQGPPPVQSIPETRIVAAPQGHPMPFARGPQLNMRNGVPDPHSMAGLSAGIATDRMQIREAKQDEANQVRNYAQDMQMQGQQRQQLAEVGASYHEAEAAKMAEIQQRKQFAYQEATKRVDAASTELNKQTADNTSYWESLPQSHQIGAAIALALGGIGSAIGTMVGKDIPNTAAQVINGHIQDWKQRKMMLISQAEKNIDREKGNRTERMAALQDEAADVHLQAAAMYSAVSDRTRAMAEASQNGEAVMRAKQLAAQLDKQMNVEHQNALAAEYQGQLQAQQHAFSTQNTAADKAFDRGVTLKKLSQEDRKIEIEASKGTAEASKKTRESMGPLTNAIRNINELIALRQQYGGVINSSPEGVKMLERRDAAIQNMKEYAGINRINENEVKWWSDMVGNPTSYSARRAIGGNEQDPELNKLLAVRQLFLEKAQSLQDNGSDAASAIDPTDDAKGAVIKMGAQPVAK